MSRDQRLLKSRMLTESACAVNSKEWMSFKFARHIDCESGENFNLYKEASAMRKKSVSGYLRDRLGKEEPGMSNGENSFVYMSELLQKEGLYLLDEPENSLSPEMQLKLADLLLYMVRYNNCQVIMSTHSPFLLSMPCAKIYNLDAAPAGACKFEELEPMQIYYRFFAEKKELFEKE